MKRTTIKLPDDVDMLLRREAARQGATVSAVTRAAIETYLGLRERRRLHAAGVGDSGHSDISQRLEEILQEEIAQLP